MQYIRYTYNYVYIIYFIYVIYYKYRKAYQERNEMKCKICSYQFDPMKEGNSRKRKCGMCSFGDSYSVRSKREYERNLLFIMMESQK